MAVPGPLNHYWVIILIDASRRPVIKPLYLVRASTHALLDAEAKRRVSLDLNASDYIFVPSPRVPPPAVNLNDGESIPLDVDLTFTPDFDKIDWPN